ncbi:MAG: hypothetical protein LBF88_09745 [Planctomycetaceae bacterium]|jgi:hypothetical protein|nr:hypothetical protein [Planctomycetaceae bacterium]
MTSNLSQTARPVAISFKDFRDEEIVDFFANESRMFHPETKPNSLGRSRLVGAPHFPMERKGTAAFRVSFRLNKGQQEKEKEVSCYDASRYHGSRTESIGTIPMTPDIFILTNDPEVLTKTAKNRFAENHSQSPNKNLKRKKIKTVEPSFRKPSSPQASVFMTEQVNKNQAVKIVYNPLENETKKNTFYPINTSVPETEKSTEQSRDTEKQLLERIQQTDKQLDRLIETWPRLSSQLKETITTLLEVSEKDGENF